MAGHTPTPYTTSDRNFRGEHDPYLLYVTGNRRFSHDDDCKCTCDGDAGHCLCPDGCGWVSTAVAVVCGNATGGTITRDTAAFIARACNSHDDLLAACKAFVQAAKDAHEHWDADRDMKVGKLLCAMAGYLDGYRAELTAAHAAIAKAESGANDA